MSVKKRISVISLESADGKSFIQESCLTPVPAVAGLKTVGDSEIQMTLVDAGRLNDVASDSDLVVLLVHFMDLVSVEELRRVYRGLEKKPELAVVIALYRQAKENGFKMSCFVCGQKMWVPDEHAGHRGRCPKCKKKFDVLSRKDHVRSVLGLVEGIPVVSVESGTPETFTNALKKMAELLKQPAAGGVAGRTKIRIKKRQVKNTFRDTSMS